MRSEYQTAAELRDGSRAIIRPIAPGDATALSRALERLSEESRYRRFLSPKTRFSASELRYLTEVDHHDHEALIAYDPESGAGLGVARFVRSEEDPQVAEAAIVVVDDWQGRGLGRALLDRLAARAEAEGVHCFSATVLGDNRPFINFLERMGAVRSRSVGGGAIELVIELPAPKGEAALKETLRAAASGELVVQPERDRQI